MTKSQIKLSKDKTFDLINVIHNRNKNAVVFRVNDYSITQLYNFILDGNYTKILYIFGYVFLLELLNLYEEYEFFELCHEIKTVVDEHNKNLEDKIPTKI